MVATLDGRVVSLTQYPRLRLLQYRRSSAVLLRGDVSGDDVARRSCGGDS
jgi:hypothetical protein